ncbi:PadR family transcriptional regulator [Rhizohabitans arisaemae]|uniref:PadR family transcriptional regulator n=1 Tax=Rhizohabitans arisaemae TaxID=2720610 RepID=UPI0024B1704C|nr:PadR family transcriptional regulator [Rhizohabitans arisaemae]
MSLPHALLGLLALEPRTGYELTKMFEGDLSRYAWQAGHTNIYPELGKMAAAGLIEVTAEGARGSRTYALTARGRAELRSWMMDPPQTGGKVRNVEVLRMFLIPTLSVADSLTLLHRLADQAAAELDHIEASVKNAEFRPGHEWFGVLAAEFGALQYKAMREWALWAIEQLSTAGKAADPPPAAP